MPSPRWTWDDGTRRFRDGNTGRFVSEKRIVDLRDQYTDARSAFVQRATDRLTNQGMSLPDWERLMREETKDAYINQYMLGRGGRNVMTQRDWGIVGRALRDQYGYLDRLATQIASGEITPGQARARARMYIEGSVQMFETAKVEGRGIPRLNQVPGDGKTQCLSNCRCHQEFTQEADGTWLVTWILDPAAEHCEDCERLAAERVDTPAENLAA